MTSRWPLNPLHFSLGLLQGGPMAPSLAPNQCRVPILLSPLSGTLHQRHLCLVVNSMGYKPRPDLCLKLSSHHFLPVSYTVCRNPQLPPWKMEITKVFPSPATVLLFLTVFLGGAGRGENKNHLGNCSKYKHTSLSKHLLLSNQHYTYLE